MEIHEHLFGIDLITSGKLNKLGITTEGKGEEDCVLGLYAYDASAAAVRTVSARAILLATGGTGQTYLYTANPSIATGDDQCGRSERAVVPG